MADERRPTDGGTPRSFFAGFRAPTLGYRRRKLSEWALTLTRTEDRQHVLELGCKGGDNLKLLLESCPHAKIAGVDPSAVAVEKAGRSLKDAVEDGRCEVLCAELNELPLRSRAFELAVSADNVDTFPEGTLGEAYRVLKPLGILLVYALEEEGRDRNEILQQIMKAGFSELRDFSDSSQGYIGIVACKR